MKLAAASATDQGLVRANNEDAWRAQRATTSCWEWGRR